MAGFTHHLSDSPILALSHSISHQGPLLSSTLSSSHIQQPGQPSIPSDTSEPSRRTARKRSRDEASINLEPDVSFVQPTESYSNWSYGEGMVLSKPCAGYVADAGNQSGTWVEEQNEKIKAQHNTEGTDVRNHKSQRLDTPSNGSQTSSVLHGRPLPGIPIVSPTSSGPIIDYFTIHLGIGWRRLSENDHEQAAARGWARFIENNYPLTAVQVCLESQGLQSYLVEANQGYFLFSEDLKQARLVSRDMETAIRNLQHTPPTFEGSDAILPSSSPPSTPKCMNSAQVVTDTEMRME